ncbi:MAG: ABC transporter ATP-binding protein [Acidimicrobiia bacterium]|nr:ABC transporter ATP-binding protein [Acidimicrobiia bacterium]MYF84072.1 ABC transporter ATP-binding protein [Acidimicrobiia bacterium]
MSEAIETRGLTKYYGDAAGIVDLDLAVEVGEVFGFIGPNGAGKTTTIRLLLNFLQPTRGSGTVFGMDITADSVAIRSRVGYLPGDLALYPSMTGREFLLYFSRLRGVDTAAATTLLADRFELDLDRRIKEYSKGNRQKVGLVNAFMHEPELLILDEPTGGLDPLMQQEFATLLGEVRAEGRTVFLSSHYLPEVERMADRVGIIRQGHLIAVDTLDGFRSKVQSNLTIEFARPADPSGFAGLRGVMSVEARDGGRLLSLSVSGPQDAVIRAAADAGAIAIHTDEADLDDVFLSYYGQGDPESGPGGSAP